MGPLTQKVRLDRVKGILITVSTLIVILGILESYQRVKDYLKWRKQNDTPYGVRLETASGFPITDSGGSVILVHHPHLLYRFKEEQKTPGMTINAEGFRGRDWVAKGPSSCRIIVLGGSATWGVGASGDDKVFVSVLERLLNTSSNSPKRAVEVFNAGVSGYDSTQELILLVTYLLDYQPDVLILFDGWNDVYSGGVRPQGVRHAINPVFDEIDYVLARNSQRWANVLRVSAFFRMLERKLSKARQEGALTRRFGQYSDNLRVYLRRWRRNLERMVRFAKAYGSEVIIIPQPELFHRKGEIPAAEQEVRRKWESKKQKGYSEFVRAQYLAFVDAAREVALAEGVPFVDGTSVFDEFGGVAFVDSVHLTDEGNEALARRLLPIVWRVLARKASASGCKATSMRTSPMRATLWT